MFLSCNCCCLDALGIIAALVVIVIAYFKWSFGYWKRRNVPFFEGKIPYGSVGNFHRKPQPLQKDVALMYKIMKARGEKQAGMYLMNSPVYLPIHPDLIKNILTKDFEHFVNHGLYYHEKKDPISAHLLSLEDEKWKKLRAKLTPTFTSGQLKAMFETVVKCGDPMKEAIDKVYNTKELDIKELVACYTTDVIGSCAFGIDCNSFKVKDSEFRKFGKKCLSYSNAKRIFLMTFPNFSHFMGIKMVNPEVSKFFRGIAKSTVDFRKKNNIERKDFMQLLINLMDGNDEASITMNELAAQSFLFFIAGFETSSSTLTFCLYELSQYEDLQEKARQEIKKVLAEHDGKITYEAINEMKYLDQCIKETLRKYPPIGLLERICNKNYNVPDMNVTIKKGIRVLISTYGLHHDREYFPEPDIFDPDRFSDANKDKLVPFTYLPFGEGPRACIGLRFGMVQVKVGLVNLLTGYKLRLSPKTPNRLTVVPDSKVLAYNETIYLQAEKIN